MPPEQNDEERRELIRELEEKKRRLQVEKLNHDRQSAEAERTLTALNQALLQANMPLPSADACSRCWVFSGKHVHMRAVPHPDPRHFDRLKCPDCQRIEDRRTGK